jgi:hypothetical protein
MPPLRHGQNAERVETLQADEQPVGLPAPACVQRPAEPAGARDASGRLVDRQYAAELASRGGHARAARAKEIRSLRGLGLGNARPEILNEQLDNAEQFANHEIGRLARECGGGICPNNAAALVQQGALAMAGSRAAYAEGDTSLGAKLGVEVRQNLLAARELTVREAQSRPKQSARERIEARIAAHGAKS